MCATYYHTLRRYYGFVVISHPYALPNPDLHIANIHAYFLNVFGPGVGISEWTSGKKFDQNEKFKNRCQEFILREKITKIHKFKMDAKSFLVITA
jgi:hypothetical protein